MAIILGRNAKVAASTDNFVASDEDLGKVLNGTMDISTDIADATTNDSSGFKEGEYADQQMSVDVTMKFDAANAGQQLIIDEVCTNRSKLYIRIRPIEAGGAEQWLALCTIDSMTLDFSTGEVEELSFTASSSGTVSNTTQ